MMRADNPGLLRPTDLYSLAPTAGLIVEPNARVSAAPAAAFAKWTLARMLFAFCAIILAAQGVLIVVKPQAMVSSNVLIAVEFLIAGAGCLGCAFKQKSETRMLWILIASGLLLSIAGQIEDTYDLVMKISQGVASLPDFFFLIYGIPVLLAISFTADEADLKVIFWLDGAQAIVAVVLIYLQIFLTLPWTVHSTAISATSLMYVYDIENLVLAGAVTMRLFGNLSSAKRRVYIALSVYLWSYALVAFALNYFELERNIAQGLQDVFWGLPCLLLLAVLAFWPERSGAITDTNKDSNRSMALMLDNLSPVVFTLVIVIMGARIAPAYPWIGFSSIAIAVMLYGLRAALLQSKYLRSQQDLTRSGAALVDAIDQLRDISIRDGLTGIYNRRHFDEVLLAEWKRSIRTAKPLSLLLIDVDNFKKLNDRYGHPEGDECLKKIAEQLSKILRRSSDTLARYGGEEFVAILPETTKESAQLIADAMRLSVEDLKIKNEGSKVARVVTVSIGVCSENTTLNRPAEELLNAADAALYRAKKLGRNCVQIA
jgi:diguanylate cyclase (GGDEF)-like protein